jgi:hypothetical protein
VAGKEHKAKIHYEINLNLKVWWSFKSSSKQHLIICLKFILILHTNHYKLQKAAQTPNLLTAENKLCERNTRTFYGGRAIPLKKLKNNAPIF